MTQLLLSLLRKIPVAWRNALLPPGLRRSLRARVRDHELREWIARGRPVPPPHGVKVDAVREHARRFGTRVLIETGTYMGDMIDEVKHAFDEIYSIELDATLHQRAQRRFAADRHVHLIQGDSGSELRALLPRAAEPALFWLDAHYSGDGTARGPKDTPIVQEVEAVLGSRSGRDVILIDDARRFTGENDYPTLEQFEALVRRPGVQVSVADDIIRIHSDEGEA
jgi:hypothetical protein